MLDFTHSVFTEVGFRSHFYGVLKQLIDKPPYQYDYFPSEDADVYNFYIDGLKPKEMGRVYFYDDEERCIDNNLANPLCEGEFKKYCIQGINKDHLALIQKLTGTVDSNRKLFDKELHKAKAALNLLLRKHVHNKWIEARPYILDQIDAIRVDLANNFSSLTDTSVLTGKYMNTLKWHGSLAKLCNVFMFISKESTEADTYFIDATREEIIMFIQRHFTKEDGGEFDRDTIAKYMNPNQKNRHDPKIRRKVRTSSEE